MFWLKGYNLNNLGRGPLDEATDQIPKTWAFWFQSRRLFKGFPYVYVKHVGPWAGPFLAPGLYFNKLAKHHLDGCITCDP